jgi:hypothetical protein
MKNLIIATLIFAAPFCIAAETPWQTKNGDVLDVFTNGVVLRTFTTRAHARPEPYYVNSMQRKGGFFGPLAPTESILALNSPEKIAGPIIFIKNVSEHKKVEPPGEIAWRVRKTGETILWKGKELECWEEKAELPEAAAKRAEQERENEAVQQESERRAKG